MAREFGTVTGAAVRERLIPAVQPGALDAGGPRVAGRDSLIEYPYQDNFDLHPDGKRMVVVRDAAEEGRLVVFTNCISQIKAKVP